jgi:hypothetical protein
MLKEYITLTSSPRRAITSVPQSSILAKQGHSIRSNHLLTSSLLGIKAIKSIAYRTNWPTLNSPYASRPKNEVKSIELARANLEEWITRSKKCRRLRSLLGIRYLSLMQN